MRITNIVVGIAGGVSRSNPVSWTKPQKSKAQKSGAGLPAGGFLSGILPENGFHLPAGRPFEPDK